ncbi:MAG: DUF87 domain-containing protein [Candidatus Micrarchaeales archaeon]|nr:DUF87 domain-containing protein [Candidatus Micrarchaeales archaeon]
MFDLSKFVKQAIGNRKKPADAGMIMVGRFEERLAEKRVQVLRRAGSGFAMANSTSEWRWRPHSGKAVLDLEKEPNPHILIVGMSGYGKSTLCKSLIFEICGTGRKMMVFDVHNEHGDAIKSAGGKVLSAAHAGINIFALDGMSVADRISDLTNLFTEVYNLGNLQSALLAVCLWYTYRKVGAPSKTAMVIKQTPTISDLVDELTVFLKLSKSATERQGLRSMRSKFLPLNSPAFNGNFIEIEDLKNSVLSFSLAKLKNKEARTIYISEMLKRLYVSMKDNEKERGVRHYIMIDEAQSLIGSGNGTGEMIRRLIEEGRKYGVGLIVATHSASNLDRQIVANSSTFISFYSREPEEVEYVASLLGGGHREIMDRVRQRMMSLGKHEALMMKAGFSAPALVKTKTAAEVISKLTELGSAKDEKAGELIDNIIAFTYKPTTKNALVGKFGKEAEAQLDALVSDGRISTLQWKADGNDELWCMARRGNLSVQHEVYVRKISDGLKNLGVPNVITVNGTNKPDIIGFANGWKAAIEYETGSKPDGSTREMLSRRSSAYKEVYVFVADEHYQRYASSFGGGNIHILKFSELGELAGGFHRIGADRPGQAQQF